MNLRLYLSLFIVILLFSTDCIYAQKKCFDILDDGENMEYDVFISSRLSSNGMSYRIYLVDLKGVDKNGLQCFLDVQNRERVIELLSDNRTDWITNIVLYSLTGSDAIHFYASWIGDDKIKDWRVFGKAEDLEKWKAYFYDLSKKELK